MIVLRQGTLWQEVVRRTEDALRTGALQPIPTDYAFVEDSGISFFVRVLSTLQRKDLERKKQDAGAEAGQVRNPFLPYEEALFVADVSDTHVALLNKFNVVEHHLLLVTRRFEEQDDLLTLNDFEALAACMNEYKSLGFYNGGEAAGASQRHKHLQVIPLPIAPHGPAVPIEPLIHAAEYDGAFGTIPAFPFRHVLVRFSETLKGLSSESAERLFDQYSGMLAKMDMSSPAKDALTRQSSPYCLLVTGEWMLLVPRTREFFGPVSVNSLGYAGALLVRDDSQMAMLKKHGPMEVLKAVSVPR